MLLLQRVGHRRDGSAVTNLCRARRPRRASSPARSASGGSKTVRHYGLDVQSDRLRVGRDARSRPRSELRSRESGAEIVFCTQSETSTGVVADVQAIKAAVGDATLVVDAVSSLGAVPLETDAWGIDVAALGLAEGADVPARARDGLGRRARSGRRFRLAHASTSTGGRPGRHRRSSTLPSRRPSR